jgi:hypothetical protein
MVSSGVFFGPVAFTSPPLISWYGCELDIFIKMDKEK